MEWVLKMNQQVYAIEEIETLLVKHFLSARKSLAKKEMKGQYRLSIQICLSHYFCIHYHILIFKTE
jgi:hypothetical protein